MRCVTLVIFCVLCSFSLVSSKYPLHYKNLRTGDDDDAIDDDVGVDDDVDVALSGENDRNEGVDDDEIDSNEGKNLSEGNDENDAIDDEFNVFTGDDENAAKAGDFLDDDENTGINNSNENQEIEDDEPSTLTSTHDNRLKLGNGELEELKQYERELEAGDLAEFFGNNHHREPRYYKDLGRRFVPVYPYKERKVKHRKPSPEQIVQFIMSSKKVLRDNEDTTDIVPIMAPADVVVAVMKNGTKKYSSKPSEPTEEVIRQYMLRSGDYWDGVWKEDVKPDTILRTKKNKHQKETLDIQPFASKLVPGTKLYDLLARIVKKSPKLLYFINN